MINGQPTLPFEEPPKKTRISSLPIDKVLGKEEENAQKGQEDRKTKKPSKSREKQGLEVGRTLFGGVLYKGAF